MQFERRVQRSASPHVDQLGRAVDATYVQINAVEILETHGAEQLEGAEAAAAEVDRPSCPIEWVCQLVKMEHIPIFLCGDVAREVQSAQRHVGMSDFLPVLQDSDHCILCA